MRILIVLALIVLSALSVFAHPAAHPLSYVSSYTKIAVDANAVSPMLE
jgi:hypothetical protein